MWPTFQSSIGPYALTTSDLGPPPSKYSLTAFSNWLLVSNFCKALDVGLAVGWGESLGIEEILGIRLGKKDMLGASDSLGKAVGDEVLKPFPFPFPFPFPGGRNPFPLGEKFPLPGRIAQKPFIDFDLDLEDFFDLDFDFMDLDFL